MSLYLQAQLCSGGATALVVADQPQPPPGDDAPPSAPLQLSSRDSVTEKQRDDVYCDKLYVEYKSAATYAECMAKVVAQLRKPNSSDTDTATVKLAGERNLQRFYFAGDNPVAGVNSDHFRDFLNPYPLSADKGQLELYGNTMLSACIMKGAGKHETPQLFMSPCPLRLVAADDSENLDFYLIAILCRTDAYRKISFVVGHQPTGACIICCCSISILIYLYFSCIVLFSETISVFGGNCLERLIYGNSDCTIGTLRSYGAQPSGTISCCCGSSCIGPWMAN